MTFLTLHRVNDGEKIVDDSDLIIMQNILIKIHHFLLPREKHLGYFPYIWLGYLLLYFFTYVSRAPFIQEIVASIIGLLFFFVLYFSIYRRNKFGIIVHIMGIWLIGAILAKWNYGSTVFFVYAACFCSHLDRVRDGFIGIGLITMLIVLQSLWFHFPAYFYLPGIFFTLLIGSSTIFYGQLERKNKLLKASQEEIERLATLAERERIVRDLHDLIGHTFSLLTKKAELAQNVTFRISRPVHVG